jgi:hypothetical protein
MGKSHKDHQHKTGTFYFTTNLSIREYPYARSKQHILRYFDKTNRIQIIDFHRKLLNKLKNTLDLEVKLEAWARKSSYHNP